LTDRLTEFRQQYERGLSQYLAGAGEVALERAYQLGRQAMVDGIGILEMGVVHHQVMMAVLAQATTSAESAWQAKAALEFFVETLSPFEITHRGFQEANLRLHHVLQVAATLGHELRTPLSSIMVSAGMLEEALHLDPQRAEGRLMSNILAAANAIKARIDELVDIAGFHSGTLSIHPEPINPVAHLRALHQRLEPEVLRVQMRLNLELSGSLPNVVADPGRVEQVVSNLVHNAMKFASEGGRIDVRALASGGFLVIEVQDYGPGIPPPDQSRLFHPYFRVERDRGRVSGLGIGLALCRELVEAHSGRIWVESEEGKGSTFRFSLPLEGPAKRLESGHEGTGDRGYQGNGGGHQPLS